MAAIGAHHGDLHRLSWRGVALQVDQQIVHRADRLAVDGYNQVAAALQVNRGARGVDPDHDIGVLATRTQPGLLGRTALDDLGDVSPAQIAGKAQGLRPGQGIAASPHTQVCVVILAILDQRWYHPLHNVDGDGEPDAAVAPGGRLDLRIDADDLPAFIQQWPARVARVNGRVRLNRLGNAEAADRRNAAPQAR